MCVCASYLYDLLQGAQPGDAVLLEQFTGAVLNQHGEQAEPLEPAHTQGRDRESHFGTISCTFSILYILLYLNFLILDFVKLN